MPIIYPNAGGGITGDFATKQSNSFNGSQTITGSLIVSGSNVTLETNTRSQIKVADERLDLIVTGSRTGGTQILLDATNQTGPAQIYAQATNHAVMQAGSSSANYPYYFHADAENKFVALEADDPTATIFVGGTGYASAINIGSAGSRVITVGNTGSLTGVVIKSGTSATSVTGSLVVSGTIYNITGGIKFPDGSTLTSSVGLSGGGATPYEVSGAITGALTPYATLTGVSASFARLASANTFTNTNNFTNVSASVISASQYIGLPSGGGGNLQNAYDNYTNTSIPAIQLTDGKDLWIGEPTSGLAGFDINGNKNSAITLTTGSLTLQTTNPFGGFSLLGKNNNYVYADGNTFGGNLTIRATANSSGNNKLWLYSRNTGAGIAQTIVESRERSIFGISNVDNNYNLYLKADSATKTIDLQVEEYDGVINIGTLYSPSINIGNASSVLKTTGSFIVSGTIQSTTGGIIFPDGSTLTSSIGLGGGGGGSGTVNSGNSGYIAYYPSSGTTVDDTSTIYTNGTAVAIGTSSINPSAILEIAAINKGMLFPRVSGSARATMTGIAGLIVYQTDTSGSDGEGLYIYKSTGWIQII